MARGWESKSIEAQQAEASEQTSKPRAKLTLEQAERVREKESLRLSRQRILQQLQAATDARHRDLLQRALADLDDKLQQLGD